MRATHITECNTCGRIHNTRAQEIETQTSRKLTIETRPTPENLASCNAQSQSPLFSILPPEIRTYIFSLALLQYEDLSNPYPEYDYCYRPGHRARRIVSTSLLQTCRLVWLEANQWSMTQATHYFWYDEDRRPDWARTLSTGRFVTEDERFDDFFDRLTGVQYSRVRSVHIFAQKHWLEWANVAVFRQTVVLQRQPFDLNNLTVTMRHSDWDDWEVDGKLRLGRRWVRVLLRSPEATRFSEFCLELETVEWKVDQLRKLVEKLRSAGEANENEDARWELVEPFEETTWSGPTNLGGREHSIYVDRSKLDYRVITMKWKRLVPTELERRWRKERSLLQMCEPPRPVARTECQGDARGSDDETDTQGSAYSESDSEQQSQ